VLDAERSERPSKFNAKKMINISDFMLRSPPKSLRQLAQKKDTGAATAHETDREKLCLFPYKVTKPV
jgi:hypothetical protein